MKSSSQTSIFGMRYDKILNVLSQTVTYQVTSELSVVAYTVKSNGPWT